jgi:hypothetical protein
VTALLSDTLAPGDRVWNAQAWGSWLEFRFPEATYAFDSRVEVIPPSAWAEHDTVLGGGPGWAEILDSYDVAVVVTEGDTGTPLGLALSGNPDWRLVWADNDGTVWQRLHVVLASAGLSSPP